MTFRPDNQLTPPALLIIIPQKISGHQQVVRAPFRGILILPALLVVADNHKRRNKNNETAP